MLAVTAFMASADEYWDRKVSLYDSLRVSHDDIVFLGNSITDGGEFSELFGMENVLNRGIISDIIPGVMKRLDQVTDGHPKKIFLLIGINDVSHGHPVSKLAARYAELVTPSAANRRKRSYTSSRSCPSTTISAVTRT